MLRWLWRVLVGTKQAPRGTQCRYYWVAESDAGRVEFGCQTADEMQAWVADGWAEHSQRIAVSGGAVGYLGATLDIEPDADGSAVLQPGECFVNRGDRPVRFGPPEYVEANGRG
jgi:hypothetical protein